MHRSLAFCKFPLAEAKVVAPDKVEMVKAHRKGKIPETTLAMKTKMVAMAVTPVLQDLVETLEHPVMAVTVETLKSDSPAKTPICF
jgi:hypothetical protein